MLVIHIYEDSKGYIELINVLENRKIDYGFGEIREYTKAELDNAKLYDLNIEYPWEHDIKNAEDYGTLYNSSNKCRKCGLGREQISELVIDTKKIKNNSIITIIPEIVVTEELYNLIIQNGLTGCEFKNIKDFKGRNETVLYQLLIHNVLPPMDGQVKFEIDKVAYCELHEANGVYLQSEIVYNTAVLSRAKDFNLSYEYIGNVNYCERRVIVSDKFRELFKKNKLKGINFFEPIKLV